MKFLKVYTAIFLLSPSLLLAQQVAKVSLLKGVAEVKTKSGQTKTLKQDDWVEVGDLVSTKEKSIMKLVFTDKSTMNLGPNSEMNIAAMGGGEAGLINVIKGQIRSQVTKDVLKQNDEKSKLIFKTKTAAMGVRGTDLMITFNPENLSTALVTFEGNVAMAQIDANEAGMVVPQSLDNILNDNSRSVEVTTGTFSGANPALDHATIPVKISPAQFETLKANENFAEKSQSSSSSGSETKQAVNSVVPPGIPPKAAMNDNIQTLETTAKPTTTTTVSTETVKVSPPPEGAIDKNGAIAPAAGGFVDLKTAIYIAPPPGSTFDKVAGVYVPPPSFGTVNLATGEYKAPEGLKLNSDGTFVPEKQAPTNSTAPQQQQTQPTQGSTTKADSGASAAVTSPKPVLAIVPITQAVINPTAITISSVAAPPPPMNVTAPPPPTNDVMGGGFFVPGNYFVDQNNNGSLIQNTNPYSQLNVTVTAQ